MKKVGLIIADQDTNYIESLANYIRNSEYSSRFDVKLFSQKDRLNQFLSGEDHINVLLASTNILPQQLENFQIDSLVLLDEQIDEEEEDSVQSVFKYQPLGNLLSQVLSIHYERNGKSSKKVTTDGGTKVISVYSATGGTGKTTVAFNLAKEIVAQDYRVFYLNLELINTIPLLFDVDDEISSSPLLYYLKTNAEQLTSKIEDLKVTDSDTNIDFFNLIPSAEEMKDLTEEELEQLINQLVESENYHYIVVDLDSTLNQSVLTALKKSDHVFWLLNNDIQSFHKTSYLLEELHAFLNDGSFSERVSLVLNRYTGKIDDKLTDYGLKINAFLPYVPQWKEVLTGQQLTSIPVFNEYILKLYNSHFEMNHGGGVPSGG